MLKQIGIKKRIIIVASPNVQENFRLQLFDSNKLKKIDDIWTMKSCTGNKYLDEINQSRIKGYQKKVLSVRPGITGPAQFAHRDEEQMLKGQTNPEVFYLDQIMPQKIAIDLKYIHERTIITDIWWLLKTVFGLLIR